MNSGTVITRTLVKVGHDDVDGVSATRQRTQPTSWLVQGEGWNIGQDKVRWSVIATPNRYGDVTLGPVSEYLDDTYDPFAGIVDVAYNQGERA